MSKRIIAQIVPFVRPKAKQLSKPRLLWEELNRPFSLWFASTIIVGTFVYFYGKWYEGTEERQKAKSEFAEVTNELYARLGTFRQTMRSLRERCEAEKAAGQYPWGSLSQAKNAFNAADGVGRSFDPRFSGFSTEALFNRLADLDERCGNQFGFTTEGAESARKAWSKIRTQCIDVYNNQPSQPNDLIDIMLGTVLPTVDHVLESEELRRWVPGD